MKYFPKTKLPQGMCISHFKTCRIKKFNSDESFEDFMQSLGMYTNFLTMLKIDSFLGEYFPDNACEKLCNLKYFSVFSSNNLKRIPKGIDNIKYLRSFHITRGKMQKLSNELFGCNNINYLVCSGNYITEIPDKIGELSELYSLALSSNLLTKVPATLGNLSGLVYLNLSGNFLTELPPEFGNLKKLRHLLITGNCYRMSLRYCTGN